MATYEIPLIPSDAAYDQQVTLDGNDYTLSIHWNEYAGGWYMDLLGLTDTEIEIRGIRLVTGINLLRAYPVPVLGEMWVIDGSDADTEPTFESIGDTHSLLYVEVE